MNVLLKKGDIFEDEHILDFVCITTNSILNKNGELVMGAGVAKRAKDLHKELPKLFGEAIKSKNAISGFYGMLLVKDKYVAFQTKVHWKDKSPIDIVKRSISMLERTAIKYKYNWFGLPFPAINNGGLTVDMVLPYLEKLPDNVIVYHLEDIL